MTTLREAAQQALEGLEKWQWDKDPRGADAYITALRAALAQQAEPTVKESLPVEPTVAENATTQQQIEQTPPSDYRRGYWDGFNIGKREGRIEAEDELAQQAEPVEPVAEARYDGTLRWLEPHGVGLHRIQGPLYTAPPQRKPLPKHDQHCVDVPGYGLVSVRLVRAVERAHGIGRQTDPQIEDRLARHGIPKP